MKIPFIDLQAQYRTIGPALEAAVIGALRGGQYVLGEAVERFEQDFAAFCGARYAVGLNSGTSALHLALLAAEIGAGDEVITVSASFVATTAAILYAGARPVFVDIDPDSWLMDPAAVEAAITPRTRAILPVHLHGRLADMAALSSIARRHGLVLIEDAAQAHGAERGGKRAGSFGHMGCFSFYPGKNLGACGEAGAVVTDDAGLAASIRALRDWGQEGKYNHLRHGFNYRMEGLQGAALNVKLPYLAGWTAARRRHARIYQADLPPTVGKPAQIGADHACHVYALRAPDRERLRADLQEAGIATNIHYPRPIHLQPAYAGLGYRAGQLPATEALAAETLSLPLYPELEPAQLAAVIAAVRQATADACVG